jgi:hypothetical protein
MAVGTPQHRTFEAHLHDNTDPYFGVEASLLNAHGSANGLNPTECRALAVSAPGLQLYLIADSTTNDPAVITAPFPYQSLAGVNDPRAGSTYSILGDVEATNPVPQVLEVINDHFHQCNEVTAPVVAMMEAEWGARAGNEKYLEVYAAGAADTELVRCRRCVPIPHPFAAAILAADTTETLTWRWLWTTIGAPIVADAVQLPLYRLFLDYMRVASIQRAQVAAPPAGAPTHRAPQTARQVILIQLRGALRTQVNNKLHLFLPGHRQQQPQALPYGPPVQLQAPVAAALPTLDGSYPVIAHNLRGFCEVLTSAELPIYWVQDYAVTKATAKQTQMEAQLQSTADRLGLPCPLIGQALALDISAIKFTSPGIDRVTRGLSVFRINTHGTDEAERRENENLGFALMIAGQATSNMNVADLVLRNNQILVLDNEMDFILHLQAYFVLLVTFLGMASRAVQAYMNELLPHATDLAFSIRHRSPLESQRRTVYMTVLMYIFRVMNVYLTELAGNVNQGRDPPEPPDFGKIIRNAQMGNLGILTQLPDSLFRTAAGRPGGPPQVADPPPPAGRQLPPPGRPVLQPPAGGRGREQRVVDMTVNPRLRRAWAALHTDAIYRQAGDRFYDPNETENRCRKIVLGDDGKPLCLPFSLTSFCYDNCRNHERHHAISESEERTIAAAATPPINL